MLLPQAREANFRRGTIMGLTAAEAFMLICFILLLLLSLWRESARQELAEARAFEQGFTENQRKAAIVYRSELEGLGANLAKLDSFNELLQQAGGEAKFRDALRLLQDLDGMPPEEVTSRARLLDDKLVKQIAESVAVLPDGTKRKLAELSAAKEFLAVIEQVHSNPRNILEASARLEAFEVAGLEPDEIRTLQDELNAFRRSGRSPDDIRQLELLAAEYEGISTEVAAFRETGLTPGQVKDIADSIEELRNADMQSGAEIATAIRAKAGALIDQMGGQILENGSVIFPENVLFDDGKSDLKPEFDKVLSNFCKPWLEVLESFDSSLRNVQIEGHASSEWQKVSPEVAFIKNLVLSQKRAAAVFQRCLEYVGSDRLGSWARTRLAAVGYSSSRPVITDGGDEDKERSRRVVFALDTKTVDDLMIEKLVAEPQETATISEPPNLSDLLPAMSMRAVAELPPAEAYASIGYREVNGRISRVIDGDTIIVGTQKIRLEGLHAPELDEPYGQEARNFVERNFLGTEANCWMSGKNTFDREVGVCLVGKIDIAGVVVVNALGRDCTAFSKGRYAAVEKIANRAPELTIPDYCRP